MTEKVYFIGKSFDAPVKIGCSGDIKRRLARIQLLSADELLVLHLVHTPAPYQMEAFLHDVFSDYRVRGEWFRIPDLSVGLIEQVTSGFDVPERRKQGRDPYTAAAMVAARELIAHFRKERSINVAQASAAISTECGISPQLMWKLMYRPFVAIPASDYAAIWNASSHLFPELAIDGFLPQPEMLIETAQSEHLPNEPTEKSTPRQED